jgi:N-acetyl sugar amidotransferase
MSDYRACTRCVMDTTATDIEFDENGVCNYCSGFVSRLGKMCPSTEDRSRLRGAFLEKVKASGKGRDYDCIVGVSGGVDSSYALYLAVEHGLRPLAVHLDNGWNSELAVHNIASLVDALGVDLYTHVIDWEENRDLQLSFFKAGVVDIELLMDNAMLALNYRQAARYGLKYILSGSNAATEGMIMPPSWNNYKYDARNIRDIHRRFGSVPIRTHPVISTFGYVYYELVRKIKWISFLDYFEYNKKTAIEDLSVKVGFREYPYKHYESVFTRFYQGYILPEKFGIDKRRLHLSALIACNQMTREEALELLEKDPYPDPKIRDEDRIFVMKKLGFTEQDFRNYMNSSKIEHEVYRSEKRFKNFLVKIYEKLNLSERNKI